MTKLFIFLFSFCFILFACSPSQGNSGHKNHNIDSLKIDNAGIVLNTKIFYDTSVIAILPIDTATYAYQPLFKDVTSLKLTNRDLQIIDSLLSNCIVAHNSIQDTTKEFSEYIDLKKYRRQYVPFIDSKGKKKVYVNCFCISDSNFNYWKKELVQVLDGGSCFFNLLIDLTNLRYKNFSTNGYG